MPPAATRTIRLTLDVTYRDLTGEEIADAGLDDFCDPVEDAEDCLPDCHDFSADEAARLICDALKADETQVEMFAGSGIFAKVENVQIVSAGEQP